MAIMECILHKLRIGKPVGGPALNFDSIDRSIQLNPICLDIRNSLFYLPIFTVLLGALELRNAPFDVCPANVDRNLESTQSR